jgi:hypothetical protein
VVGGEVAITNVKVVGWIGPGIEPMIYSTRGKQANHYTVDAVKIQRRKEITAHLYIPL